MSANPHLEALLEENAEIADPNTKRKSRLTGIAIIVFALVGLYLALGSGGGSKPKSVQPTDEEFRTSGFRPPGFTTTADTGKSAEPPIVKIEAPKAVEEPTKFEVPPPPPPVVTVPETAPVTEAVHEEAFPARYRSGMIQLDESSSSSEQSAGLLGNNAAQSSSGVAGSDDNSKFLANSSNMGERSAKASKINRLDAVIPEGTMIPGILETAISSDLPGQIRAITSEDVYSFDGRRVLVPAGSRLLGEYKSELTTGQTRVFVIWNRLIRSDGVNVALASIGTDAIGRSGLTGQIDNHWRARFGSAIMMSIVGAGTSYVTGSGSGDSQSDGAATARQTIANTFSRMADRTLSKTIDIPPTINVRQGGRINIFVRQDLDFSKYYDDPVTEALKEIKNERRGR